MEARIAEAQNTASIYTFLIPKNIQLRYLDVIKRMSDNEVFQITSDSSDKRTPTISRMELSSVTARKWRLLSLAGDLAGMIQDRDMRDFFGFAQPRLI